MQRLGRNVTLALFDYQVRAAEIMATRDRFGLHDEMGVGKTATTIGAIDRAGCHRGMVICPAMLRENWIKEFAKFSSVRRRIAKGKNIHDYVAWSRERFDILVTSYEQATKWTADFIKQGEFIDFVVFDEAHYLKNVNARRTIELLGHEASGLNSLVAWAARAWHVTGTPMANDPLDIYTFLRFTKAINLDLNTFVVRFFDKKLGTYGARHFIKSDMVAPLQQLIYNNSIRRTHKDVGIELPPILLKEVFVEGKTIEIRKAMEAYPNLEQQIIDAIESGNIENLAAEYIAAVRRLVGKAKAVAYAEILKMELDAGAGKRVVFCWHTEPLLHVRNYLEKYGYNAVAVYGSTPDWERQEAVHRFMQDPSCKVFIGNIKVAGTGLTLTESNEIDMLESDWSPAGNAQAIKRVHRYGQENEVRARFITLTDSVDVAVNRVVAMKTASIAEIEGYEMTAAPLDSAF